MEREYFDPWPFYPSAFMDGEYEATRLDSTQSSHSLLIDLTSESLECAKRVHEVLGKSKQIYKQARHAMTLARKAFLEAEVVATIARDASARCSTLVEAIMKDQKLLTEDQVYRSASPEAKQSLHIEEFQQVLDFGSLARQGVILSPSSFDNDVSLESILVGTEQRNSRNVACQSMSCDVQDSICQTDGNLEEKAVSSQEMQTFNFSEKNRDCARQSMSSTESGEIWRRRENIPPTIQQSSEDFLERLCCSLPTVNEDSRTEAKSSRPTPASDSDRNGKIARRQQPSDESVYKISPTSKNSDSTHVGSNTRLNGNSLMAIQQQRLQSTELIEDQSQGKVVQAYNVASSSPERRSRPGSPLVTDEENRRIMMQLLPSSSPQLFQPKRTRSSSSTD